MPNKSKCQALVDLEKMNARTVCAGSAEKYRAIPALAMADAFKPLLPKISGLQARQ